MKEKIVERVLKLLEVKSVVTFALVGTLCVLASRQNVPVPSEALVATVTAVVTYFFTRQTAEGTKK